MGKIDIKICLKKSSKDQKNTKKNYREASKLKKL